MIKTQIKINGVNSLEKIKNKSPCIILFGETHGFFNDIEVQKKMIENTNPKYYLYELLEDKKIISEEEFKDYLSKNDEERFSIISTYGEIKPIIKLAQQFKLNLIGCDIKNMGRINADFLKKNKLTPKEEKFEIDLLEKREKHQAKIIAHYLKFKENIFVSLGAYHLRKESEIFKNIKKEFIICYPTWKGQQKFEPSEEMKEEEIIYIVEEGKSYLK